MPATTTGANENLFSYMSTLSLRHREEKKRGRERESLCENERDTHTWLRRNKRPGEKPLFIPTLITHCL